MSIENIAIDTVRESAKSFVQQAEKWYENRNSVSMDYSLILLSEMMAQNQMYQLLFGYSSLQDEVEMILNRNREFYAAILSDRIVLELSRIEES